MSKERKRKQKKNLLILFGGLGIAVVGTVVFLAFSSSEQEAKVKRLMEQKKHMPSPIVSVSEEKERLRRLEAETEKLREDLKFQQKQMLEISEDKILLEKRARTLESKNASLERKIEDASLEKKVEEARPLPPPPKAPPRNVLSTWGGSSYSLNTQNVSAVIPATTIVKCVILEGVDCNAGLGTPSGKRTVLLQTVKNGHLPKGVRAKLKGARIIAEAWGDISSERVYMRCTELRQFFKGGDFVSTQMRGYVSGDDGKEGVRGVVTERSGKAIFNAGVASFFGGVGESLQATLNNQTLEKLSKVGDSQTILDVDTFRNAGLQGAGTSVSKWRDYWLDVAKNRNPVIQIRKKRTVDVVFLADTVIGEKNMQKKINSQQRGESVYWKN